MADWFNDAMNFLSSGNILGVPVAIFIAIIGMIAFIVFLIITRRPRHKEFKPIDLKKQIKKDLNTLYDTFKEDLGKPLYRGSVEVGKIKGYMPLVWNKQISIKDNITMQKYQEVKDAVLANPSEPIEGNPTSRKRREKMINIPVNMKCLKVCSKNKLKKLLRIGTKYHIVEDSLLSTDSELGWVINGQPLLFYDIIFYNQPARDFIENTGFRMNRENEMQEIANAVPRVVFWDNEMAKRIIGMREQAEIEAKKFKGQKESAED